MRQMLINLYELATDRQFMSRLEELRHTQWLSREEVLALQQKKLYHLLEYAYKFVPYYRYLFDQVNFQPNNILNDPDSFQKCPTISKAIINDNFDSLITTDPKNQGQLARNFTGGSTGQPLTFVQDNNFRDYVTANIHRQIEWTGWQVGECHAYIWGTDYEMAKQQALRSRLMNWALNRFVTNAFALNEADMSAFAQKVRQRHPKILFGYASALTRFAEFVQSNRLDDIKFSSVISSAEMLYPHQREIIASTFCCDVLDRYSSRELGDIACECPEHTGLHISAENVIVEVLRDDTPVSVGEEGDIVVTNLNNYGMPFIRYHTGDVGCLSDLECRCGRGLPMLEIVHGRATDLFKTEDGNTIHGEFFTHLFYGIEEVKQFQVVQKAYDHVIVSIVKKSPVPPERLAFIERAIKDIFQSDVTIEFEFVDDIPLKSSGKYRFTISEVD